MSGPGVLHPVKPSYSNYKYNLVMHVLTKPWRWGGGKAYFQTFSYFDGCLYSCVPKSSPGHYKHWWGYWIGLFGYNRYNIKMVWTKIKIHEKMWKCKNREPEGLEIFAFFANFIFSHSFKGIKREMYLSFMLATSRNGKNSFLKKCDKKL